MSKFWAGNSSDEDDEEEYDESEEGTEEGSEEGGDEEDSNDEKKDVDDEEEDEDEEEGGRRKQQKKLYLEESDDEDQVRVVKTAKQKYIESLLDISRNLQDFLNKNKKNGDWLLISQELVLLQSQLNKFKQQVRIHGMPGFLIKQLAILESTQIEFINKSKVNKDFSQNFSSSNWKSVNGVGNRLKKFFDEQWRKDLEKYNKDPTNEFYNEPKEEEDRPKEQEKEKEKSGPKRGTREFWVKKPGDESSEESEDGDEDLEWLDEETRKKKEQQIEEKKKKKEQEIEEKKKRKEEKRKERENKKLKETNKTSSTTRTVSNDTRSVEERIEEVNTRRGKSTELTKLISTVGKILNETLSDEQRFKVLVLQLNLLFDQAAVRVERMDQKTWKKTISIVEEVLKLLQRRKDFELAESGTEEEQEASSETKKVTTNKKTVRVVGSIITFFETIEQQYVTSLQQLSPLSSSYIARFSDELILLSFIRKLYNFYVELNDSKKLSYFAIAFMKYSHYKLYASSAEFEGEELKEFGENNKVLKFNRSKQLQRFHSVVLKHGEPKHKSLSVLYLIYHMALHDQFHQARDLLLLTRISDFVIQMDTDVQVMYNRCSIQIGLSAFRQGLYEDAHLHLHEIYNGQKIKELLAQGVGKFNDDKTSEQIRGEKFRTLPAHMHIPLEVIEAFHLVSAVLLEVPNMAASSLDPNKKVISKKLRKLMNYWEDSEFKGPPETLSEQILAAARALQKGDWQKAEKYILGLKVWNLVPDASTVKSILEAKLRRVALTSYVLTYSPYYDSISLDFLTQMFNLSAQQVNSIVNHLILTRVLIASWHQPSKTLVIHHSEPSKLQHISSQISDKLVHFVENNERVLDSKTGVYGYKNENTYERFKNNSRIYNRYAKKNNNYY